jgi:hypothetical protein
MQEAARTLRPGGRLLATTLARHEHDAVVAPYRHANLGFSPRELERSAKQAGLQVESCAVIARERRPPHFEVICLIAGKPAARTAGDGRKTQTPKAPRTETAR